MSTKPSYLGLLNAIALGESRAHAYLTEWIKVTTDSDVCAVLTTVAAREGEHGMAFAKRINELGYTVLDKPDPNFEKQMAIACSNRTDLEKMEKLGLGRLDPGEGKPDIFDKFFTDHTIDIQTGALLGRYIAEERDTGRMLRCCYEELKSRSGGGRVTTESGGSTRADLDRVEQKVDALCEAVGELRALVLAGAASANGKERKVPAKSR